MPVAPATQEVEEGESLEPASPGKIVRLSFCLFACSLAISLKFGGCWAAMVRNIGTSLFLLSWLDQSSLSK